MNKTDNNYFNKFINFEIAGPIMVLITMLIFIRIFIGADFFTKYNLFTVLRQFGFIGIVALGETMIILVGGIDLSVGAVAGFTGIISAWVMANTGMDPYLCLLLGVLLGIFTGFINGFLINKMKLNPFIVTLGIMQIYFSLNLVITKGIPISDISRDIIWIGRGKIDFIPIPVIILIILTIILEILLRYTSFGRKIYSIGNNAKASLLCGVKVTKIKILMYMTGGFFAALGGITSLARFTSGQPNLGNGWEMLAIPAVIIGGGSLDGGRGTPVGTLIGIMIITLVKQIIVLLHVSSFWQEVVIGLVILLAVLIDQIKRKSQL